MPERVNWLPAVVEHIERNIRSVISVDALASLAGCSPRHLQRLFHEATAEGVMEYVRGRRVTLAMAEVSRGERGILDIALDYGYESQEAFTRSFQARFAFPPRRFYCNGLISHPAEKAIVCEEYLQLIRSGSLTLEPKACHLQFQAYTGLPITLAVNSHATEQGFSQISATMVRFRHCLRELGGHESALSLAPLTLVSYRVPVSARRCADGVVIVAALEARYFDGVPEGLMSVETPGGEYVAFTYSGPPQGVKLTGRYIMATWFPRSPYWFGNGPALSQLRASNGGAHVEATFLLPIRKRNPRLRDPWWE